MFKINLEKELIKQNRVLLNAKELLLVKEGDKLGDLTENETMKTVFGHNSSARVGKAIKERSIELSTQAAEYDQERVFHFSQIESLCKKYHLKFLPSVMFKGSIDPKLPLLLDQFQIARNIHFKEWKAEDRGWRSSIVYENGDTFIAAPASSFELRERPKDPLFFYKINTEYYYLIHKWGNNLSMKRRAYKLFSNSILCWLLFFIPALLGMIKFLSLSRSTDKHMDIWGSCAIASAFILIFGTIINFVASDGNMLRLIKKNNWNSQFKD